MGAADTPQMERGLKSRHVEMIAIGGIIGAGLFVGSSTSIATVGPAVIVSYLLAGLVILLVMRMLSEMAVANPGISSFTEFARLGLGNGAGFVTGWLYWYFWVVVVGIEAIAGAKILSAWLPFEVWEIGLGLMLVMTAVNLMSARSYGEFEFWFSSLKVAAILVFIAIAGAYVLGLTGRPDPDTNHLVAHGGFAPHGWLAALSGVVSVIFALTGAEIATIAAAESAEPTRTIARLTWSVCARILLFYVVSISLIVAAVPWTSIVPGESPFAAVLDAIHIPYAGTIMNIVVLIAVLSCLNSGLYVTSRVLFALAVRGDAPQALVKLNRRKVPARAILIGSLFGYGAVIASVISPERVFTFLLNASGAIMLFIYSTIAVAQIRQRQKLQATAPERLTLKMWFFPYASWFAVAAMAAIMVAMALSPSRSIELYSSLVVLGLALTAYQVRKRAARPAVVRPA